MTIPENAVKELLSRSFLRLVANQAGFVTFTEELDFGVDLGLRHVDFIEEDDRVSYRSSGFVIDVQLKATCEDNVALSDDHLAYDLPVHTYNHLVTRSKGLHTIPLVLTLFVLPDNRAEWLAVADSEVILRRCGYIWRPTEDSEISDNTSTQRIYVPLANRIRAETFVDLREEYLA